MVHLYKLATLNYEKEAECMNCKAETRLEQGWTSKFSAMKRSLVHGEGVCAGRMISRQLRIYPVIGGVCHGVHPGREGSCRMENQGSVLLNANASRDILPLP